MNRFFPILLACLVGLMAFSSAAVTEEGANQADSLRMLESFAEGQALKSDIVAIKEQEKREIMFYMGIPLIIMLLITAGLGVAMVVYQKKVFVAHMVFAGLSLTLALAHAVVGTVWFYPF